jgi:hypothetical protein
MCYLQRQRVTRFASIAIVYQLIRSVGGYKILRRVYQSLRVNLSVCLLPRITNESASFQHLSQSEHKSKMVHSSSTCQFDRSHPQPAPRVDNPCHKDHRVRTWISLCVKTSSHKSISRWGALYALQSVFVDYCDDD